MFPNQSVCNSKAVVAPEAERSLRGNDVPSRHPRNCDAAGRFHTASQASAQRRWWRRLKPCAGFPGVACTVAPQPACPTPCVVDATCHLTLSMRASSIADIAWLTSKRLCGASDGSFADCSLGSASAPAAAASSGMRQALLESSTICQLRRSAGGA